MASEFDHPLDMPFLHAIAVLELKGEAIPPQNADQIDACIAEYEAAERLLKSAEATHTAAKAGLIALVNAQGARPAGAEYSKAILGRRNRAMVTRSQKTVLQEQYVDHLGKYCAEQDLDGVFERLFETVTSHKLIKGARTVLASLGLPKTKHEKVLTLFARCFDTKPNAPSLKVELITPEKPARAPRAAKKAVA